MEDVKLEIYTSYYAKMKNEIKKDDDIYIQVSRTCPFWFSKKIDENVGEYLGNYSESLEDYEDQLKELENISIETEEKLYNSYIDYFVDTYLKIEAYEDIRGNAIRVFLLCYENTKKNPCHRTIIANYLNNKYNLNIKEY